MARDCKIIHILLADAQPKVKFALKLLLETKPNWKVVGEANNRPELLHQLAHTEVDILILDWNLPGLGSLDFIDAWPGLCVIALAGRPDFQSAALEAGANAFVSKVDPPEKLVDAITTCAAELFASPTHK